MSANGAVKAPELESFDVVQNCGEIVRVRRSSTPILRKTEPTEMMGRGGRLLHKRKARIDLLVPDLVRFVQDVGSGLLELKVYDDKAELFLHDPRANVDPSWLWRAHWVWDLPFLGPQFEVEAIANPLDLAMTRDKGVYRSPKWAIRAITKHVADCMESEKRVQKIVRGIG